MQMREHLEKNSFFSKYQSAYRKFFPTETALVKVTNNLLLNLDRAKSTLYLTKLPLTLSIMNYFFQF